METFSFSKTTGQLPYVLYDGEDLADSNLIMDFFSKERSIDEAEGLTGEQSAAASAITAMLDDQHSWWGWLYRIIFNMYFFNFSLRFYWGVGWGLVVSVMFEGYII